MRQCSTHRRARRVLAGFIPLFSIGAPAWAADHFCNTSAEFTTALNNSAPGDTITLNAANTFTAPSDGFILPQKSGSTYITIRSSNHSSLPPEGQRIQPSDAANMPDIRPPSGGSRAMWTAAPPQSVAHHWKLVGIEFIGAADNSTSIWPLLEMGTGAAQNTIQLIPHHFIVDRCYFHGNSPTQGLHQVVTVHGNYVDIINSNISDAKRNDKETQCIWGVNSQGWINIINNYLEGAGENILFGGGAGFITGVQPENILIRGNYFYKPNSWKYGHPEYDGMNWHVKNHLELKCGRYVTIDGNIFDNCWYDAGSQYGASIVLKTSRTNVSGDRQGSPWFTTEHVTLTNNIIRNVGLGFVLAGSTNSDGSSMDGYPANVTIRNNLAYNVTRDATGNTGEMFRYGSGCPNVTVDHNTLFQSGSGSRIAEMWGAVMDNHVHTNNINIKSTYTWRSAVGASENCFAAFFVNGFVWDKNVIIGATSSEFLPNYDGWNPDSLQNPSNGDAVLVDYDDHGTNFENWKVKGWDQPTNTTLYPYHNTGTDGKDIGCDIDALNAATAGCITGVWSGTGTELVAIADSKVRGGTNGSTNYGNDQKLHTRWDTNTSNREKAYMRFDVSGISGTVSGAELRIHVFDFNSAATKTIQVYGLNNGTTGETTWTETGITWNNAPGNDTADNDFLNATLLGQFTYTGAEWQTVSGSALDSFINADTNDQITVMMRATGTASSSNITGFSSKENSDANGPRLMIPQASTLIASDGIGYTGSLNTQNGGNGWGGAWTAVSGWTNPALATGSLSYTDSASNMLVVSGNKIQPAINSRSVRNIAAANQFVPTNGSTLWVSFRINHTGTGSLPSNHAGFALYSTENADSAGDEFFMGNPGFSGQNWGFNPEGGTRVVAPGTVSGGAPRDVQLLYKLAYGASSAAVSMWINPNITSEATLGTPQATGTQPGLDPVRSVIISTGSSSSGYQFDELRIGTTFNAVTPKQ